MKLQQTVRKRISETCIGASVKIRYQPRTNTVKDEKVDLFADSRNILARWRYHFSQLLNVYGVNDVRHIQLQTAETLVPEPSAFEVEMATEKLKRQVSPSNDEISAELVEARDRTIHSEIHKLVSSFWSKQELSESGKSQSVYL
jgi:hypothetical protein